MQRLKRQLAAWTAYQFPQQTVMGKIAHLKREVNELENAIGKHPLDELEECADAMMLLLDIASKRGITLRQLKRQMRRKLKINKARTWGEPNADGSITHVQQP